MNKHHITDINFKIPKELTKYNSYPKITNYVSTVKLKINFDVNTIPLYLQSADKKPRRFAAIIWRIVPTTCLLYSNGNMIVIGAKTRINSILSSHIYRLYLENIPQYFYDTTDEKFFYTTTEKYTKFDNFAVKNVVGSGKLFEDLYTSDDEDSSDALIDLDSFARDNIMNAGLDKEIFPGMRCIIEKSKDSTVMKDDFIAHIFKARKNVLMGATCKEDIYFGHNHLKEIMAPYLDKKNDNNNTTPNINSFFEAALRKDIILPKTQSTNTKSQNQSNNIINILQQQEEEEQYQEEENGDLITMTNNNNNVSRIEFKNMTEPISKRHLSHFMSTQLGNDEQEDLILHSISNEFDFLND